MEASSSSAESEAGRAGSMAPHRQLALVKRFLDDAEDEPILAGSAWYLVGSQWMGSWIHWARGREDGAEGFPGIGTADIVDPDNVHLSEELVGIRSGLRERRDYWVLPEACFRFLVGIYGMGEGELELRRQAYEYAKDETRIEVQLARIDVVWVPAGRRLCVQLSHVHGVAELKRAIGLVLEHHGLPLPAGGVHYSFALSGEEGCPRYTLDERLDAKGLDEVGLLTPDACVWVDVRPDPAAADPLDRTAAVVRELQPGAGLVGLRNLGNTCFMNSALQCLSNCEPLRAFFLGGAYTSDVNKGNPLGTGGALVEEFAALLRTMWTAPAHRVVDPMAFKYCLGRFEGRFLGYHQQDSQEFLSALLDRVHEDLNRIRQKPYVELPDRNGRSDALVAQEAWAGHLARNDSRVVDLFHGQLRSTVTCPECRHVSVTFDPFMFLTLPLPNKRTRSLEITVISEHLLDMAEFRVPKAARTVGALKDMVLQRAKLDPEQHEVVLIEVYANDIYRHFRDDDEALSNIRQPADRIHAYLVRRDQRHCWLTFSVKPPEAGLVRVGFPLLVPVAEAAEGAPASPGPADLVTVEVAHRALVRFSQSPRLDSDQLITLSVRKHEKSDGRFPHVHAFVAPAFWHAVLADMHIETDEEAAVYGFSNAFLPHHSRLPSPLLFGAPPGQAGRDEVGLHECLDLFVQEERLSPSEAWYCSRCKAHREGAAKKLDLWELPEVLVVHLKRFSYDSMYGNKVTTPVAYPVKYAPPPPPFPTNRPLAT